VPTYPGRREEIFIENREENIRVTRRSLSYNSQWWNFRISLEFLTHLQKATPRDLDRNLG